MNRRYALKLMAAFTVFGRCLPSGKARALLLRRLSPAAAAAPGTDSFKSKLQADMARLATRVYSEQGIPMLLTCQNLTVQPAVVPSSGATNAAVSPAFERYCEAWNAVHPDASAADVARLVELLAYRDFAAGGKDTQL